MSNTKCVQLIILNTEFTLDKQSMYQMICPRKVVILTKCYSLQLCSSHYHIADSFQKKKLFKQNIKQHSFVIFLQGLGSNLLWLKICGHYEAGIELFVYI